MGRQSIALIHHPRTIHLDEGVIDKTGWLAFLGELETKSG